ncbi:MAG TPA: sigma-70 family RNA polymerase sigma factor [Chitinophagaceae bacterium]|nr:sigma-70 family RNA polymerase sigma factor [Chitinophagaceae bacterium]
MNSPESVKQLTDHLFRNEAKKMVAVLTKIFGTENLETAEDVVQDTLINAMHVWKFKGIPDNPSAWLFRVAKNKAIDIIRRNKHSVQYDFSDSEKILLTSEYTLNSAMESLWKEELIRDDMLRMMFACCHPGISEESQVTLILKTLCGFSTAEIAKAFLTTEETISKRLYRTKEFFRQHKIKLVIPSGDEIKNRTDGVLNSIYLLFNEGYNSTHSEELIRKDVMEEAMMLCSLLIENKNTQLPGVYALLSLMCFHAARSDSRLTAEGEIILLPLQDRSKWDTALIEKGNEYLGTSAFGDIITSYHLQAAIAYEHCSARTFKETNWLRILTHYDLLCKISDSPVNELNKMVAVMENYGAEKALEELNNIKDKKRLETYYLYHSLLGEIFSRLNDVIKAKSHFESAIKLTQSETERKMLSNKIIALLP